MREIFVLRPVFVFVVSLFVCASAGAQVIQLPSQRIFTSEGGGVIVPDGGGAPAAGVKRGASGSNNRGGVPPQRAVGSAQAATGQRVTATIHDPQAADARAAGQAPTAPAAGVFSQRAAQTRLAMPAGDPGLKSVAEHRRDREARQETDAQEAKRLLEQARRAEAEGKSNVAVEYYRQAAKRASGPLKQTIESEAAAVQAAAAKASAAKQQKPAPPR